MVRQFASLLLAYLFLGLAVMGVFLPGLPTVPFLLLTAWFAARGSERLHGWLYDHPHLGKLLIDWEQRKAISRPSKVLAVVMLIASWLLLYYRVANLWLVAAVAVLFVMVATYIVTRPE